jgi:hypothetical protein
MSRRILSYRSLPAAQRMAKLFNAAMGDKGTFEVVNHPNDFTHAILFRGHLKDGHRATAYCEPMKHVRAVAKHYGVKV